MYQELCGSHSTISDFRAKLLALLPIASGAGVGLLVFQVKDAEPGASGVLLLATGLAGLAVTIGLFI